MFPVFAVICAAIFSSNSILMLSYMCKTKINFELGFGFVMSSAMGMIFWAAALEGILLSAF